MAARYPAKQISEALTDFVLSQCEKYWHQLEKLSTDEINSFISDCLDEDMNAFDIPLPGTGEDYKDAPAGKIIALNVLVSEFLKAQSGLLGNNRPSLIAGIRKRRANGQQIGRWAAPVPKDEMQ